MVAFLPGYPKHKRIVEPPPITKEGLKNHCIVELKSEHTKSLIKQIKLDRKINISPYTTFCKWLVDHSEQCKQAKTKLTMLNEEIPEGVNPEELELFDDYINRFARENLQFSAEFALPAKELKEIIDKSRPQLYVKPREAKHADHFARRACERYILALYLNIWNDETKKYEIVGIIKRNDGQPLLKNQLSQQWLMFSQPQPKPKDRLDLVTMENADQPCYVSLDIDEKYLNFKDEFLNRLYGNVIFQYRINDFEKIFFSTKSKFDYMVNQILFHLSVDFKSSVDIPTAQHTETTSQDIDPNNLRKKDIIQFPIRRYVAELNMSLSYLKELIARCRTKWHGMSFKNHTAIQNAEEIIGKNLKNIYVDILHEDKKTWIRLGQYRQNLFLRLRRRGP